MPVDDILLESEDKMQKTAAHLREQYRTVRTGRASAGLVEHIKVNYYGSPTPLRQLATITVPDPLLIVIKPYDPGSVGDIVKGLQASDLGITPAVDGRLIRLQVPPLSEDRRKQLVQQVKDLSEEAKISLRNVRRDAIKAIDTEEKDKLLSEDQARDARQEATDLVHQYEKDIDEAIKHKTAEILEV